MRKDDHVFHLEEDFHSKDRKIHRKERKIATDRDRSQFKKTDQDQLKKQLQQNPIDAKEHLLRGRIIAIVPEGIIVESEGKEWICSLKGALKQIKTRMKNLVAVGDFVRFEPSMSNLGSIALVEERFSILSRADNLCRNKEQLIAVNVDQVLITCSLFIPLLKPFLIDRYIIAAIKGNMKPVIVLNKIDFLSHPPEGIDAEMIAKEKALYEEFVATYTALDIPVISVSSVTLEGLDALKAIMQGKVSVFSGQSGVGKSSLINFIASTSLAIGPIVQSTRKGSHTTTTTQLIPLGSGGFCIDTPGIKSFGLWDLEPHDLASYYSEITDLSPKCRYRNCSHINEPQCAVQQAAETGAISPLRFASYCALIASLSEEHRHR